MSRYVEKLNTNISNLQNNLNKQLKDHVDSLNQRLTGYDWHALNYKCLWETLNELGYKYNGKQSGNNYLAVNSKNGRIVEIPKLEQEKSSEKQKNKKPNILVKWLIGLFSFVGGTCIILNQMNAFPPEMGMVISIIYAISIGSIGLALLLLAIFLFVLSSDSIASDTLGPIGLLADITYKFVHFAAHKIDTHGLDIKAIDDEYNRIVDEMNSTYKVVINHYDDQFAKIISDNKTKFKKRHLAELDRLLK
jgi:hypothetical protein